MAGRSVSTVEVEIVAVSHNGQPYLGAGMFVVVGQSVGGGNSFYPRVGLTSCFPVVQTVLLAEACCHLIGSGCCFRNPALAPVDEFEIITLSLNVCEKCTCIWLDNTRC